MTNKSVEKLQIDFYFYDLVFILLQFILLHHNKLFLFNKKENLNPKLK